MLIHSSVPEVEVVSDTTPPAPMLDIVIPVYNEEKNITRCIDRLYAFISANVPYATRITIADNASTDNTLAVAQKLCEKYSDHVRAVHLAEKGRGRALRAVWYTTDAQIAAYMDVDLSTDLNGLLPLIAPLISGHSDVSIGSRLQSGSRVVRGAKREFISRSYNFILRTAMRAKFSDAQCGFKAIVTEVGRQVLPLIKDNGWFFDTELLVVSERIGLRISEVAVDWIDDPNSKVDIVSTAKEDLKGCWRVARALANGSLPVCELRAAIGREPFVAGVPVGIIGHITRFGIIGIISTALNMILFLAFRHFMTSQWANFTALGISAIFNVLANRAFTFRIRNREKMLSHVFQGMVVFAFTALLTSVSLSVLDAHAPHAGIVAEAAVLVVANIVATIIRFVAFRRIFEHKTKPQITVPEDLRNLDLAGSDEVTPRCN